MYHGSLTVKITSSARKQQKLTKSFLCMISITIIMIHQFFIIIMFEGVKARMNENCGKKDARVHFVKFEWVGQKLTVNVTFCWRVQHGGDAMSWLIELLQVDNIMLKIFSKNMTRFLYHFNFCSYNIFYIDTKIVSEIWGTKVFLNRFTFKRVCLTFLITFILSRIIIFPWIRGVIVN